MAERKLNDAEIHALVTFYTGISAVSLAAQNYGDKLTLEAARTLLQFIETGCQATAEKMRDADPEYYANRAAEQQEAGEADVIELDAYRQAGGLLN